MTSNPNSSNPTTAKNVKTVSGITVRLAGDSGDGMQLLGTQLTNTSALAGNDVATFPDFPAEIRAPRGTRAGVSGFQVQFASEEIFTPGDQLDALVVMNPAAMVTNLGDLRKGGILIANVDGFNEKEFKLAKLESDPLEANVIEETYRIFKVPMTTLTRTAVAEHGLSQKVADRCKNFFAMGLVYWLFGRSLDTTLRFIEDKFGRKPDIAAANVAALRAGWAYGETTEAFGESFQVEAAATLESGTYRNMMGNQALAWGLVTAAHLSGKDLFYGTYPITPASDILHELSKYKNFGVKTLQAEDEIAAVCATIGAAFGGTMAVTASSGPGIALKAEGMGLGMILELPMIVINVQRGGPSTGLPTKTEQSDLLQCMFGRNGEAPLPILAPRSPADCFDIAIEAWRIATECMCPVMLLSDGYIANGSEPWRIPDLGSMPKITINHPAGTDLDEPFLPYARDEFLARPWAIPGTPGLMHRVGGLEKQDGTGNVSYDPANHQHMTNTRAAKIDRIAERIPEQDVFGETSGDVLVVSWGGTYGACHTAVKRCRDAGHQVSHAHLRYIHPMPNNIGDLLQSFKTVIVPELNMGQLRMLLRSKYLVDCVGVNKVQGKPFAVTELVDAIEARVTPQASSKGKAAVQSRAG
ncbi:2-oxoacid:acceptor oxidoreductase subunit alpha [Novipirellula artificiosorum]|uniref:2-oxoglutarate oxidoreductase subunit KorA n=1 Tax=Novipirellula artificiosorum TaxID=2528016 RepID=A0A5C6E102_9BACT|nr:2-oxoacid:acceptor oxidoreductase subunit alpha [Novipirellula artificiosorum]TWU42540.1 2-oxoglutarate oxidoreductase subunit KorA [Novipirellula artificiosorum]